MPKATLTALLAAGALLLGATPARVDAASVTHGRLAGLVPHTSLRPTVHRSARRSSQSTGFTCGGVSCTGYENAVNRYFTDVAHDSGSTSNVYSVATQYFDTVGGGTNHVAYASTFGGSYVDTSPFPANGCDDTQGLAHDTVCLTDAQIQTEIAHAIAVNGWPVDTTLPTHLYVILTPSDVGVCSFGGAASGGNQCSTNAFCAYHDNFSPSSGTQVAYAVEPDNATIPGGGCDSGQEPNGTGADPTINTTSHEVNEAITDPWPEVSPGWWSNDPNEDEIGDLCAWSFGTPLGGATGAEYNQVINGHDYWLQQEYSNAANGGLGGCTPFINGPASPVKGGTGPLVYQGGPVMRTHTVYAIYWVPTTTAQVPASTAQPFVLGTAAVGKTLSATNGLWAGSPTSYAYQWLRCSAGGTGCAAIAGATSAKYKITKADAGHELAAQVSASNAAATVSSTSAPTGTVVDVPHARHKPSIKGKAKVGRKLGERSGRWTGAPYRWKFQWLRCSAKGTGCVRIKGAVKPKYTLTKKDANHRLRVVVTAVNDAGRTKATSAATKIVRI